MSWAEIFFEMRAEEIDERNEYEAMKKRQEEEERRNPEIARLRREIDQKRYELMRKEERDRENAKKLEDQKTEFELRKTLAEINAKLNE